MEGPAPTVGVGNLHQPGPGRVEPGQPGRWQRGGRPGTSGDRQRRRLTRRSRRWRRSGPIRCPSAAPGRPADSSSEMPARVNGMAAGPRLPRCGKVIGTRSRSMSSALRDRLGVHGADLVHDVPVDRPAVPPAEVGGGFGPQLLRQRQPGVHQPGAVGVHVVHVADAQQVVFAAGPGRAAEEAMALGVGVGCGRAPWRRRRSPGSARRTGRTPAWRRRRRSAAG